MNPLRTFVFITAVMFTTALLSQVVLDIVPFTGPAQQQEEAPPPEPPPVVKYVPKVYSWDELEAYLRQYAPGANITLTDPSFAVVSHEWFMSYLEHWRSVVLPDLKYVPNTFDCEDFARLFAALASAEAMQDPTYAGHGILVGTVYLVLTTDYGFGAIPIGAHAINFAVTDEGVFLIEPQSGDITPFKASPYIFALNLI